MQHVFKRKLYLKTIKLKKCKVNLEFEKKLVNFFELVGEKGFMIKGKKLKSFLRG
jgi:hypothetical protein